MNGTRDELQLRRLETAISHFLRWGVLAAGLLLAVGWLMGLFSSGSHLREFRDYHDESLRQIIDRAMLVQDWSKVVQSGGLAVLISLPIIRVFLTGILFVRQRERVLAVAAFFVFAVLIASFFLGVQIH